VFERQKSIQLEKDGGGALFMKVRGGKKGAKKTKVMEMFNPYALKRLRLGGATLK